MYLDENEDAQETRKRLVEQEGRMPSDRRRYRRREVSRRAVEQVIDKLRQARHPRSTMRPSSIRRRCCRTSARAAGADVPHQYLRHFFVTQAAMPHLKEGATIVNTTSSQPIAAVPNCSITARPKAPSWRSPVACEEACRRRTSASTAWPRADLDPADPCPTSRRKKLQNSGPIRR